MPGWTTWLWCFTFLHGIRRAWSWDDRGAKKEQAPGGFQRLYRKDLAVRARP